MTVQDNRITVLAIKDGKIHSLDKKAGNFFVEMTAQKMVNELLDQLAEENNALNNITIEIYVNGKFAIGYLYNIQVLTEPSSVSNIVEKH